MDPKALAVKALHLTRLTNELLKRAQVETEKQAAVAARIEAALPATMDAMVEHDRIHPQQRDEVMQKLASDPVAAIELLRELSAHRNLTEVDQIGQVNGSEKTAADKPTTTRGGPTADFDALPSGQKFREMLYAGQQ